MYFYASWLSNDGIHVFVVYLENARSDFENYFSGKSKEKVVRYLMSFKKQQKLLEVIGQASLGTVTSDMVNDVEFIMGFAKTKNAVDKLSNGDKVKFYGNLLVNGYLNDKDKISVDEFDEYLELINSLSYRELEYLSFFKEHSDKHRGILIYQHWEEFSKEFENKFPKRDVYFVYKRLERTGFISEVTETESVEENTGSLDIDSIGYKTESELSRFNEMVLKNI